MLKRHEVEVLLKAGHAMTEVACFTGVSLCSVKRIAQEVQWCMWMMERNDASDSSLP